MDGILVSQSIMKSLKNEISELSKHNVYPCLATILVGNDAASVSYINNKQKTANSIGIKTFDYRLDEEISQQDLTTLVHKLNDDNNVHGILIQLPLKEHLDKFEVLNLIRPEKDVDGLTFINCGLLFNNKPKLIPCTPIGVMELLNFYNIQLDGKVVSIINRSNLVGKPLSTLLLEKNSTVIICHSHTKNIISILQSSDVIINGKLLGDVDFENVKDKVSYITPVPGGVGPMTITMLLKNTIRAAKILNSIYQ